MSDAARFWAKTRIVREDLTRVSAANVPDETTEAIANALYFLDPNQGERPDASAASMWLRTTLPETHPNHLDVEYVMEKVGSYV